MLSERIFSHPYLKNVRPSALGSYLENCGWQKDGKLKTGTVIYHIQSNDSAEALVPQNIRADDYAYLTGRAISVLKSPSLSRVSELRAITHGMYW